MESNDGTIHEIIEYHRERANKAEDERDALYIKFTITWSIAAALGAGLLAALVALFWMH